MNSTGSFVVLLLLGLLMLGALAGLALLLLRIQTRQIKQRVEMRREVQRAVQSQMQGMGTFLAENQRQAGAHQAQRLESLEKHMHRQMQQMSARVGQLEQSNAQALGQIRTEVTANLTQIRQSQTESLDSIQQTVNEKMTGMMREQIGESFRLVSERLEQVYQGLGEMQSLASGVGDLKKVLSNVKARGVLGETQLESILSEFLAPAQYEAQAAVSPGSRERVDFAVRLPGGAADGQKDTPVLLPIDAKFPGDTYAALQNARENGTAQEIEAAQRQLEQVIRGEAKDISRKYITPPYTTNFAILFLPFEGLYAEAISSGLGDKLMREFSVTLAGPSTIAAMLSTLQMGFRTLAIQRQSLTAWQSIGAVRSEFEKFSDGLAAAQRNLEGAQREIENLGSVRTRAILRRLNDLQTIDQQKNE